MNDAIGLPLDSVHSLTTPLAPLPVAQPELSGYEKNAVDGRPEARQARLAAEIAAVQAADARSNYLPQVTLHGAFEADRQRFVYRGGANWLVSIGLRWNLFNGGADKAKIAESEATPRRTAAEQARAESGIRLQVRQAWANLIAAQQRIESAQSVRGRSPGKSSHLSKPLFRGTEYRNRSAPDRNRIARNTDALSGGCT
jgi:outer membrane protein TolC